MYPAQFDYHRATSLEEAFSLLDQHQDAKLIAGGHSLIPMMKLRLAQPEAVIDIARIDALSGIQEAGDRISIGALTTHTELAASELLQQKCGLITAAAQEIGDVQVRNRGTIGGNVAHADPGADLPAALIALGATIHLQSKDDRREVAAADFFVDLLTTDLGTNEIVTSVSVPVLSDTTGYSYLKFEHPASGYAVVGAAAWVCMANGKCEAAALAINGVTVTPYQGDAIATELVGGDLSDQTIATAVEAVQPQDPLSDVFASANYRSHLARVYARRTLIAARNNAR